jgi:hypothetical protein
MGSMGGMGMGGMGMGMRSVPPTGLPETTLKPGQTRRLPTPLVSLNTPDVNAQVTMPRQGEKLQIGDVSQLNQSPQARAALKRLAQDKAPRAIVQLVMWHVAAGLDWETIRQLSQGWANPQEFALAQQFVEQLDTAGPKPTQPGDSGVFYFEVKGQSPASETLAADVRKLLAQYGMLGLKCRAGVPARPDGPAVACRVELSDTKARVHLGVTNADASAWTSAGSCETKLAEGKDAAQRALRVADAVAAGTVRRLVFVHLSKGPKVKGRETYRVRIDNASPLILNGLALAGPEEESHVPPAALAALSLPPRRSSTVPATADVVERLHWKEGVQVIAADLSGL